MLHDPGKNPNYGQDKAPHEPVQEILRHINGVAAQRGHDRFANLDGFEVSLRIRIDNTVVLVGLVSGSVFQLRTTEHYVRIVQPVVYEKVAKQGVTSPQYGSTAMSLIIFHL